MSDLTPTFTPSAEEVLIMIDGLDTLAQTLEDILEKKYELLESDPNSIETSIDIQMTRAYLDQVALYRGKMQPFIEEDFGYDSTYSTDSDNAHHKSSQSGAPS